LRRTRRRARRWAAQVNAVCGFLLREWRPAQPFRDQREKSAGQRRGAQSNPPAHPRNSSAEQFGDSIRMGLCHASAPYRGQQRFCGAPGRAGGLAAGPPCAEASGDGSPSSRNPIRDAHNAPSGTIRGVDTLPREPIRDTGTASRGAIRDANTALSVVRLSRAAHRQPGLSNFSKHA